MTNFPTSLDDDSTIYRLDDNLSELGVDTINMIRGAVFAIESNLGLSAKGSLSDLSTRLNISLNPDGTIKASALTSIGLITLPVTNVQIGANAGIVESKLALDFGTSNLHTLIQANSVLLASLSAFEAALEVKVNSHIAGGPASNLRHTASMIDLNAVPSDSRDPSYTWSGLIDKDGYQLSALNVADALNQINTNLTGHQNQVKDAHAASAISVDASGFSELLTSNESVQDVLDNIDDIELLQLGTHRATQHTNGIPKAARSLNLNSATTLGSDGYNLQVIDPTPCETFVVHNPPGNAPLDNVSNGDSIVTFKPVSNVGSVFDAKFSQVKIGDIIRINYGSVEDLRRVESIRYIPGVEWTVRINGVNLVDSDGYGSFARIDRPLYDSNVYGVLAVASANAVPLVNYNILGSVIIGDPRGATALGMNFDVTKINPANYNLYLELYPTGNPADHVIKLPAIDVTGSQGLAEGGYNLDNIVTNCNNAFRNTGYNYRFIAFSVNGNFGIMLADSIDGASFAIINGSNSTGSLIEGSYTSNVVGDVYGLHQDALGFGFENANLASPAYQGTWLDATAAQNPTKVIHPVKSRNYIVNGRPFDQFKSKELTTNNFWIADINARNVTGTSVEVTYKISNVLENAGLKPGKTIVVQPALAYSDPLYNDVDYGRFIIKSVVFNNCHCVNDYTLITVINGIHGKADPLASSGAPGLPVRIYFDEGSVSFDDQNIIDSSDNSLNYHRLHEIYITDAKTTFSHERARVAYVSETSQLIDTNNWHILSVSPKFRGYKDISNSFLNKFIRLFITNYNNTSGEFDGYLGQRDLTSPIMLHPGQIVRGRKNASVKFYDDTNIDFIELILRDESSSLPGLTLVPNKWMDIEVFDSLLLDQELLPLATCEVNWNPAFGKNCIEYVKNLKQYGSISELEFTQSAVDFITAGERYLHQNGIIYGFDPEVDIINNKFLLHGGIALINGKIITTNNIFLTLPLIFNSSNALPQTFNWAVCIDDNGTIKCFPLTDTKIQFFGGFISGAGTRYVPSVSFVELSSKKNLVILYIANITINNAFPGFTFNKYSDARKFIKNETSLIPLTWVGRDVNDSDSNITTSELSGHFNNFDQVKTWINWTKSPNNIIKVKGNIVSNSTIDLSTINYPTTFDGENGCIFNLNAARGIILGSNITLKNISFNWSPGTLTYTAGDNVNLDSDSVAGSDASNACIYSLINDGYVLNNININNCKFTGIFTQSQRPPYIAMIFGGSNANLDNVKINDNKFIDPNTINNQCAIAIALLGIESAPNGSVLSNTFIEKNIVNNNQNIIVSIISTSLNFGILNTRNVHIKNNNVGAIGYRVSANFSNNASYTSDYGLDALNISNNTALFIGNLDTTGHILNTNLDLYTFNATGDVIINNNSCTVIYCNFQQEPTTPDHSQSLLISQNKLRAKSFTEVSTIYGLNNTNVNQYIAIYVNGILDKANSLEILGDSRVAQILDNLIMYYTDETATTDCYDIGIWVDSCGAKIERNILRNFVNAGIFVDNKITRDNIVQVDIVGNQLYNKFNSAQPWIGIGDQVGNMVNFRVTGNSFDTYQSNGSSDFMIMTNTVAKNRYVVKDNINQTDTKLIRAATAGRLVERVSFTSDAGPVTLYNDLVIDTNIHTLILSIFHGATNEFNIDNDPQTKNGQIRFGLAPTGTIAWIVPISLIDNKIKFVSASIDYFVNGTINDNNQIQFQLWQAGSTDAFVLGASIAVITPSTSGTLTMTIPDLNQPIGMDGDEYYIVLNCTAAGGNNASFAFSTLRYTFRY